MRLNKENMKYPILKGRKVPNRTMWACWCPYCYMDHYHGEIDGHRQAHCIRKGSPFMKTGYYIMEETERDKLFSSVNSLSEGSYPQLEKGK
ncbi:hypothetical protein [Vagococcus sp.]|uniref:hypothetical protein n=1 Tax=Vagococcus sp. TaxID=1933889 RepID=UPI003F9BF1B1